MYHKTIRVVIGVKETTMAILYILLFISVSIETFKNIYYNYFGKNLVESNKDALFFNIIGCLGSLLFFAAAIVVSGSSFKVSSYTFISAIIFGLVTAASQYFCLLSMKLGPMSFSVLFTYLSAMIPTVFGIIYRNTPPTIVQIAGLILMILTFTLSIDFGEESGMSVKWLFAVAGSFLGMGLLGVCQTVHQTSSYAFEINGFLFWTFSFAFIFFYILYVLSSFRNKQKSEKKAYKPKDWASMIITGVFLGAINLINLYLSGKLPSVIFFPIVNGGVIILSGLASILIFKEKLPKKKIAGLIIGIIATCLIGI